MSVIKDIDKINKINTYLKENNQFEYFYLFDISINTGCAISKLIKLKPNDIYNDYLLIQNKKYYCNKYKIKNLKKFIKNKNITYNEIIFYNKSRTKPINRSYFYEKINNIIDKLNLNINFSNKTCERTFAYHFFKETNNLKYLCKLFNKSKNKIIEFIELDIRGFDNFSI